MNAQEAKRVTIESLKGPVIESYISHINFRIKRAAKAGKSSIHNPQVGDPKEGSSFYLSGGEVKAVINHYNNEGFEWVDHPDPDPGHPCAGAYTTLSW